MTDQHITDGERAEIKRVAPRPHFGTLRARSEIEQMLATQQALYREVRATSGQLSGIQATIQALRWVLQED